MSPVSGKNWAGLLLATIKSWDYLNLGFLWCAANPLQRDWGQWRWKNRAFTVGLAIVKVLCLWSSSAVFCQDQLQANLLAHKKGKILHLCDSQQSVNNGKVFNAKCKLALLDYHPGILICFYIFLNWGCTPRVLRAPFVVLGIKPRSSGFDTRASISYTFPAVLFLWPLYITELNCQYILDLLSLGTLIFYFIFGLWVWQCSGLTLSLCSGLTPG